MIRRVLARPHALAAAWLQHPNSMLRATAQAAVLGAAMARLALRRDDATGDAPDPSDALVERLSSSARLREFVQGPSRVKRLLGRVGRRVLMQLSAAAKRREIAGPDRQFILPLTRPVDQAVLRNLVIWQNYVLPSHAPAAGGGEVDVTLVLARGADGGARLFDLFSVALMLDRIRNFAMLFGGEGGAGMPVASATGGASKPQRDTGLAIDLASIPRDLVRRAEREGGSRGIKLLAQGRRCANDFLKLAFPARTVIALGLREGEDGAVDPGALDLWLSLIREQCVRRPELGFVVLNRLAPSQGRDWPAHLRFARHQGLTLQDAICLAQIADGYVGVLDIFGLAALSAGRPGVYVPLDDDGATQPADRSGGPIIVVGDRERACLEAALATFFSSQLTRDA